MKTIRMQILTLLTVVIVLTGVLTTVIWYRNTQKMITQYQSNFAQSLIKNAYNSFSYVLDDSDYLLSLVSTNRDNIISPITTPCVNNIEVFQRDRTIDRFIYSLYGYRYFVTGLEVFTPNGKIYKVGEAAANQNVLINQAKQYFEQNKNIHIIVLNPLRSDHALNEINRLVPIVQEIKDNQLQTVGYAVVYLDYKVIIKMFTESLPTGSELLIQDGHQHIVFNNFSHPVPNLIPNGKSPYFKEGNIYEDTYIKESDWYIKISIPTQELMKDIYHTVYDMAILYMAIYIIAMIVLAYFVVRITNRLTTLRHAMLEVSKGNFDVRVPIKGHDELSMMGKTYNQMAVQISDLLKQVKEEERKKSEAELDFLQAQINPHFLSNTLNTVVWMANIQNANNISHLTTSLINLLHSTMHRGRHLISLGEELEYIKSYIEIEQCCNFDNFSTSYEIEDGTLQLQVLRFIIQPLLENAIKHGVGPLEDRIGKIWIRCYTDNNCLIIQIQDNGVGMTKEKIDTVLSGSSKKTGQSFNSIGVKNVNDRIQLFFGKKYGLSYESVLNSFTKATIRLPIIKNGEAWEVKWYEN